MPIDEKNQKSVKVRRIVPDDLVPKPVTQVLWTRVGSDVQLDFGHADFQDIHSIINSDDGDENVELEVKITDRFILTPTAALEFARMAHSYMAEMKDRPIVPESFELETKKK